MQYFTIFQDKLHSFSIQNRTKHVWAFSKTVQKISKITYTASRFSLLTSAKFSVNIKRVTLQHNKEFIVFIFLLNGFITMCNLKKRLIRAAFEYSCIQQGKKESDASKIGFPTLATGAFPDQKFNKQTSHESNKTVDSSCISF